MEETFEGDRTDKEKGDGEEVLGRRGEGEEEEPKATGRKGLIKFNEERRRLEEELEGELEEELEGELEEELEGELEKNLREKEELEEELEEERRT